MFEKCYNVKHDIGQKIYIMASYQAEESGFMSQSMVNIRMDTDLSKIGYNINILTVRIGITKGRV